MSYLSAAKAKFQGQAELMEDFLTMVMNTNSLSKRDHTTNIRSNKLATHTFPPFAKSLGNIVANFHSDLDITEIDTLINRKAGPAQG